MYKDIIYCCEKIQSDFTLKTASENIVNDKRRNLPNAKGYDVKDQIRHGSSAIGKDAGNLDLLINMGKFQLLLLRH